MAEKVLLGHTGSWTAGVTYNLKLNELKEKLKKSKTKTQKNKIRTEIKKMKANEPKTFPVYVSREEHKKIKEHQKLHEYDYLFS